MTVSLSPPPFFDASGNKNIGATFRIGREIRCLPYAGLFLSILEIKDIKKCAKVDGMEWNFMQYETMKSQQITNN